MPPTEHLYAANPADIARAATLLREGRLVAFATETVYGLGANALNPEAVASIFTAKQRPAWDPLIVHLASPGQLDTITEIPSYLVSRISHLTNAFWPGPLTLLLPRSAAVPDAVTAGRELVGVRIPAHPAAHALLAATGIPIAAPSANRFGHTSPTTADHVLADLDGRIDAVLDAGPTNLGLESTVLDPTQTPMVLYRPGAITPAQLTAATGLPITIYTPPTSRSAPEALPSPGVGIRHYAPRATLQLTGSTPESLNHALATTSSPTTGVILPTGWQLHHTALTEPWAPWDNPTALAAALFACLRALDDRGATRILCPLPPPGGIADAIRDRLEKAARTT
ncbi:threonylcarbamoyl-AMP synthase [Granulicella sp. 5B5]|uniref:L-threonylcarbamoyladenylate synthase n=1 Tax=Granulicella sp. 5B5 TaxID=1617967 RepID=UPI0015F695DE|nr:L-threonylcarbamoyladenylate synthase [Granulicella sp. 5B5]QMV17452.1 threonylcarbamoyl-AMP synthase [Granulicella sp. 5B5]